MSKAADRSSRMRTDDLESAFVIRRASVTESIAVPANLTWGVRDKLFERAAGVAESSGRIQVSVKPKMLSVDCKEKAEMKSALLTAD